MDVRKVFSYSAFNIQISHPTSRQEQQNRNNINNQAVINYVRYHKLYFI